MALTNLELARHVAGRVRGYRQSLALTQRELARRSGISVTSLARFEATGGITLNNLIALLRTMGLAGRLHDLVPDAQSPSPLELLKASKQTPTRKRVRRPRGSAEATDTPIG